MLEPIPALGCVLAAIVALRLALRRLPVRLAPGRTRLRVEATCALAPRQRLHVVAVDGERLLVGATDAGIRLLRRLPPAPSAAVAAPGEVRDGAAEEGPAPAPRGWRAALRRTLPLAGALLLALAPLAAGAQSAPAGLPAAQAGAPTLALDLGAATGPERISSTLELVALLTLLSVAPSILLMGTCFTRVVIVLALLRQALGVQQLPPNQVLVGLALAITLFAMAPLGARLQAEALDPYVAGELAPEEAAGRAADAVSAFLLEHTRENDLALFVEISQAPAPASRDEVSLFTLLPAFLISELRTAFEIGFTVFLPFLVIDLVVASMLISMQMIVLPPMIISLPFKLMLFVLVDGWNLIVGSLVRGIG